MRKVAALGFAVLCLSCGGGDEKAAFERYEDAVDPSLSAEAGLRRQFDEKIRDCSSYGDWSGFEDLLSKVIPFYTEMETTLSAIRPEGSRLAELHGLLLRYLGMRREQFMLFREFLGKRESQDAGRKQVAEKLRAAQDDWGEAGKALNAAVEAAPKSAVVLGPLFAVENIVFQSLLSDVAKLRQGALAPDQFRGTMAGRYVPHYEQLAAGFEKADLPPEVKLAAGAYASAARPLLVAAGELADLMESAGGDLTALNERLVGLQDDLQKTFEDYRGGAKAYRDSLR
jgi:hypothetical protein